MSSSTEDDVIHLLAHFSNWIEAYCNGWAEGVDVHMIAIFYCMFIALVDHIYEAKVTVIHQGDKHVMKKNHLLTITILT